MAYDKIVVPDGEKISMKDGKLCVPDHPIIPFIEGEFNTRIKRANDRVAKYTRKYTKKKA